MNESTDYIASLPKELTHLEFTNVSIQGIPNRAI
jgi:hypothetical protein